MKLLVVFDLDGTLIDSRQDIAIAINSARNEAGLLSLSLEEIVAAVGDGVSELVDRTFHDASPAVRANAHKTILEHYAKSTNANTVAYDGIQETLRELHGRSIAKAIVSNKPDPLVHKIVKEMGWDGAFGAVLGGETTIPMKPNPAGIYHVRDRMGLSDKTILWMVGDGPQDMNAGRAAGAKCLWAKWGFHAHQPANVDVVLETPLDVVKLLLR